MKESEESERRAEIAAIREDISTILSWVRFIGWTAILTIGLVCWQFGLGLLFLIISAFLAVIYLCMHFSPKRPKNIPESE